MSSSPEELVESTMNANVQQSHFGSMPDGKPAALFTLTNTNGLVAKVTNYGATITELHAPDRDGKFADVVLGFDNLDQYLKGHPFLGSTVGRFANRIAAGKFTLMGKTYQLAVNNGPNHLHGGIKGFDKVLWNAEILEGASVKFSYVSPDGEEGYPGTLTVNLTVRLTDANELSLDYVATTDAPTPVNLTNHTYFNLRGEGDILGHEVMLSADYYTPVNADLIPTGEQKSVRGTPMDFTHAKPIGRDFAQLPNQPTGYDINFVINRAGKGLALLARVHDPVTGRKMEAHTTQPGVQFYTANYFDGTLVGKRGVTYPRHAGFCLETQHYPDSVNHPEFPSVLLRPAQTYHHTTVYKFLNK